MKWCFLVNNIDLMMEFLGKVAFEAVRQGDECFLVFNSKIAEYTKSKFFPENLKTISKVDWLVENYKKNQTEFKDISWKEFFPTFERKHNFLNLNYDNSVEVVSQTYQFLDFIFEIEKPDIVINEAPANIFTNVAYHLCQKYNLTYIGLVGSKFSGKIDIYDKSHTLSLYEKTFEQLNEKNILDSEKEFSEIFVKDFTSHKKLPPYMDFQFSFSNSYGLARYVKRIIKLYPHFLKYLSGRNLFKKFDYESESLLKYNLFYPFKSLLKKFRALYFKKEYNYINEKDKFFLYPLHFYPEASTLVLATYFSDQLNTIKNIAFSLPFPYKLYVKEHPIAIGTRSADFYQKIGKLPNVTLISPDENNKDLIEKSVGVITLTSTVGMEAALLGKPVYVLGDVFYDYHPLCQKIKSFEGLKEKINYDLTYNKEIENLNSINNRFILSYFKNTIPGDVVESQKSKDSNDYKEIYKSIKNILMKINE